MTPGTTDQAQTNGSALTKITIIPASANTTRPTIADLMILLNIMNSNAVH